MRTYRKTVAPMTKDHCTLLPADEKGIHCVERLASLAMRRKELVHGFPQTNWDAAKSPGSYDRMRQDARNDCIFRVKEIRSINLAAHDPRLFHLLGDISSDEDSAGHGMLTVVVVHKTGDMQPGPGFFELAKRLGRNTSNILKCWVEALRKVHAVWSRG